MGYIQELFVDKKESENYLCMICMDIVKNPLKCNNCNNMFCKEEMSQIQKCPGCRNQPLKLIKVDAKKLNEYKKLKMQCQEEACKVIMLLSQFDNHDQQCQAVPRICPMKNCLQIIPMNRLIKHLNEECKFSFDIKFQLEQLLKENEDQKEKQISELKQQLAECHTQINAYKKQLENAQNQLQQQKVLNQQISQNQKVQSNQQNLSMIEEIKIDSVGTMLEDQV